MSKILAVDSGYANLGAVVMEKVATLYTHEEFKVSDYKPIAMYCLQTEKNTRKVGLRCADDNARRIMEMAGKLCTIIREHGIKRMVVELPHTGGQSAAAVRVMAYSTALIVTVAECFNMACEFYTPYETRAAAGAKGVGGKDVKKQVMAEMERRYPGLAEAFPTLGKREHVADALATFEAARGGNLVRLT